MSQPYWSRRRISIGAAILVLGGVLIVRNVMLRVDRIAKVPVGQPCVASSDCASGDCIPYEGRSVCTQPCGPGDACPSSTRCVDVVLQQGSSKQNKRYCVR